MCYHSSIDYKSTEEVFCVLVHSTLHYRSARKHKDGSSVDMDYLSLARGFAYSVFFNVSAMADVACSTNTKTTITDNSNVTASLALVCLLSKRKLSLSRDCSR